MPDPHDRALKQNLRLLTPGFGPQNNLVLIRSTVNDLFIAAVEARSKTSYFSHTELLPFPLTSAGLNSVLKVRSRCTPDSSLHRKPRCIQQLGAMVLSKEVVACVTTGAGTQGMPQSTSKGQCSCSLSHGMLRLCYVDSQLKN